MWLHRYLFEIGKGSFDDSNVLIRLFWVPALCQIPKDTLWGYSRASHGLIPHFRQIGANRGPTGALIFTLFLLRFMSFLHLKSGLRILPILYRSSNYRATFLSVLIFQLQSKFVVLGIQLQRWYQNRGYRLVRVRVCACRDGAEPRNLLFTFILHVYINKPKPKLDKPKPK